MAYLKFVSDGYPRDKHFFSKACTIGRTTDNDICISEDMVSRRHAAIRFTNNYYVLEDLGSKNGVWINSKRIHNFVPKPLFDNDRISISTIDLIFNSEGRQPPGSNKKLRIKQEKSLAGPATHDAMGGISVIMKQEKVDIVAHTTRLDASTGAFEIDKEITVNGLKNAVQRFQAMIRISSKLGVITESDGLLEKIMEKIFDVFPQAERSFIMLRDKTTGKMRPAFGRSRLTNKNTQTEFEVSQTIINHVIEKKQSILSSNAIDDKRFVGGISIAEFSIRSLMYVPFIYKEEILGIITVDTPSAEHAFSRNDLTMLTGIAAQAAVTLKNVQLYKEVQKETQLRTQLSRYLSIEVVEGILKGAIPFKLGGEEKYGTVLFCDIVGFTSMSESMTAVEVIEKLNRYFQLFTDVISRNKGTLHKFEGDMVMAFWNVLIEDPDADLNAIRSALEMQAAVWRLGFELEAEGSPPLFIGVGCNTGTFAGGNIGGTDNMEYTVIGDNINLGQRIESLAGRWQVFVSESTFNSIKDSCIAIGLPKAVVKGKAQYVNVFSIRGIQIYQDIMLMAIPVVIRDQNDTYNQRGIITGCCTENGRLTIGLSTQYIACQNERIFLRFFLQETGHQFFLNGLVDSVNIRTYRNKKIYANCVLSHIEADEKTYTFLKPAYFLKSEKNWEEMRRR